MREEGCVIEISDHGTLTDEHAASIREKYQAVLADPMACVLFVVAPQVERTIPAFWECLLRDYFQKEVSAAKDGRREGGRGTERKFSLRFRIDGKVLAGREIGVTSSREDEISHRFSGVVESYMQLLSRACYERKKLDRGLSLRGCDAC